MACPDWHSLCTSVDSVQRHGVPAIHVPRRSGQRLPPWISLTDVSRLPTQVSEPRRCPAHVRPAASTARPTSSCPPSAHVPRSPASSLPSPSRQSEGPGGHSPSPCKEPAGSSRAEPASRRLAFPCGGPPYQLARRGATLTRSGYQRRPRRPVTSSPPRTGRFRSYIRPLPSLRSLSDLLVCWPDAGVTLTARPVGNFYIGTTGYI